MPSLFLVRHDDSDPIDDDLHQKLDFKNPARHFIISQSSILQKATSFGNSRSIRAKERLAKDASNVSLRVESKS